MHLFENFKRVFSELGFSDTIIRSAWETESVKQSILILRFSHDTGAVSLMDIRHYMSKALLLPEESGWDDVDAKWSKRKDPIDLSERLLASLSVSLESEALKYERKAHELELALGNANVHINRQAHHIEDLECEVSRQRSVLHTLEERMPDMECDNGHPRILYWSEVDGEKTQGCPLCAVLKTSTTPTA